MCGERVERLHDGADGRVGRLGVDRPQPLLVGRERAIDGRADHQPRRPRGERERDGRHGAQVRGVAPEALHVGRERGGVRRLDHGNAARLHDARDLAQERGEQVRGQVLDHLRAEDAADVRLGQSGQMIEQVLQSRIQLERAAGGHRILVGIDAVGPHAAASCELEELAAAASEIHDRLAPTEERQVALERRDDVVPGASFQLGEERAAVHPGRAGERHDDGPLPHVRIGLPFDVRRLRAGDETKHRRVLPLHASELGPERRHLLQDAGLRCLDLAAQPRLLLVHEREASEEPTNR